MYKHKAVNVTSYMKKTKKKKVVKLLSWKRVKSLRIKDLKSLFLLVSRGRLHYVAIVLFCGLVGAGGLKLTLSSFAATPTGTLDIITYVGAAVDGNEIGSVDVAVDQGGSGVQCSPPSGTTDAGAGANHGHVHLTCPAAAGGGPRTYVFSSASRAGYSLSGASPHAPGSVFHVSGGQTTTLSIVMNDDTPPPVAAPVPDATPAPAGAPNGTVDIVTYDGSVGTGNEIGSVDVAVDQGGSGVQCSPSTGTTQAGTGDNHGHVHLTCPAAADGGPRTYKFVSASRLNYVVSPNSPHPAGDTFHVSGGATTTLSVVMDRVSSIPPPVSTPAPAPTSIPTGTLDIITYDGSVTAGNEIGSVDVVTDQGGSGVQCSPTGGTTDAGTGANHGHVHLTCPAAADGGPRTYKLSSASRFNFVLSPNSPHVAGDTFHVSSGATTTLSLVMDRVSSLPPPVATPTPTPSPAPSNPSTPPPPANQKTGSAQVTTYIYHTDGSKTRLGGVNLHIQSVNYDTTDSAHSCNNYNETSDSSGTPASNAQYGQVHFNSCWIGATGNGKVYQLSYTQLPAGYSFRSFHITGPAGETFSSGATSNTDGLNEQFKINPNDTTKLEVWLNQNDESQTDLSNVKQVVTQTGTRYVPADDSEASKQAAAALNLLTGGGTTDLSDIDPDEGDDFGDENEDLGSPTAPGGLTAVQDASGSVSVTWQASTGDPVGENVSYSVQRTIKNSTDDPEDIGDTTTDLSVLDTSDNLEYPQTYVYIVSAFDENDNTSDESTVEITTTPLASNVAAAVDPTAADPAADTTAEDPTAPDPTDSTTATDPTTDPTDTATDTTTNTTTINSPDQQATLVIPDGATSEPLSCSVSSTDSTGADLLADIGTVVGDTAQPVCRDDTGNVVDDFTEEVDMTLEEDNSDITDDTDLYGFDGTDWEKIPADTVKSSSDSTKTETTAGKGNIKFSSANKVKNGHKTKYTVKSKRIVKLALVDRRGSSINPATPIVSLMLLLVLGVAARIIVQRRLAESYNPSYSDADLMAYDPDKARSQNQPDPASQVVSGEQPTYSDPTVEPRITPIDQPRFIVHPDKPKDKQ